jgi:peptidoglycan hydrolase-like protein with peptidoglycan-binding domain
MKKISIFEKIFLMLLFIVCLNGVVKAQFFENLQQYIDKIGGVSSSTTTTILKTIPSFYFSKTLRVGDENFDVLQLQKLLAIDKSIYPEGLTTGFFGSLTKRAVTKFQEKYANEVLWPLGLTKGTGLVGSATIKKLNTLTSNVINTTNTSIVYGNTTTSNRVVDCANNGDWMLVCSLNKTGQTVTMPNKCFSDQVGYTKLCDGGCPCRTNTSNTTIFTYTTDTTQGE